MVAFLQRLLDDIMRSHTHDLPPTVSFVSSSLRLGGALASLREGRGSSVGQPQNSRTSRD